MFVANSKCIRIHLELTTNINKRKSRVCYYKQELQSLLDSPTGHIVEKDNYEQHNQLHWWASLLPGIEGLFYTSLYFLSTRLAK